MNTLVVPPCVDGCQVIEINTKVPLLTVDCLYDAGITPRDQYAATQTPNFVGKITKCVSRKHVFEFLICFHLIHYVLAIFLRMATVYMQPKRTWKNELIPSVLKSTQVSMDHHTCLLLEVGEAHYIFSEMSEEEVEDFVSTEYWQQADENI